MELQEFVRSALMQVVNGVRDAQNSADDRGGINPYIWQHGRDAAAKQGILESNDGRWIHLVEFDVAITAVETEGKKGGIGVVAGAVGLGARRESGSENTSLSRIRFSVPVAFPRALPVDG